MSFSIDDLKEVYDNASCLDHPVIISWDDLKDAEVIYYWSLPDRWETETFAVGKLPNGKFVAAEEWSDSSGHG